MPLPLIAGVVRAAVTGRVPSLQPWANVWHFRYSGGASSPGDSDIAALDALFVRVYSGAAFGAGASWLSSCQTTVTLDKISYVRLDGTALGLEFPKTLTGALTGNALPSECAHVLTLRSNQRGRSHRGRVYMPCLSSTQMMADGKVNPTRVTSFIAQVQGLQAALGGASVSPFWEMGVASYLHGYFTPLVLPTMDVDVDVQRRRRK